MYSRKLIRVLSFHIIGAAILFGTAAFAADLASQSSESGGVAIAVKPLDVSAKAATWSFQVSLNAQSQDLGDDLVRTAFIVNRAGKKNELPTGWEGDAPGGRYRKGVLRFKALAPLPAAVELRIQRAGEKAPRVFRWDLDCPCNDPKMHAS
ncbi:MAG: hypothetical protein HY661_11150 [Betaproteobacteria bacterium]|nr:hypothetical protein [Betaproteobacteria bacterium]